MPQLRAESLSMPKMKKSERERLLERIAKLEREKVDVIAERGTEKLRFEETLRDLRGEMNEYILAGMLLMRESIRTRLKPMLACSGKS